MAAGSVVEGHGLDGPRELHRQVEDMARLGLGLEPAQVQQQIGPFIPATRRGQVVKQVGEEVAVVRAAGPAVRALRLVSGQQLLMRGRGDGSRALDVVVDQVVE